MEEVSEHTTEHNVKSIVTMRNVQFKQSLSIIYLLEKLVSIRQWLFYLS
jgi:hypothetical protein